MKIKLGIFDYESLYLERLVNHFSKYYSDKLEVHSFSTAASLKQVLPTADFDVFLMPVEMAKDKIEIPDNLCKAYLVDQNDIEKIEDVVVIGKYQKPDAIYRQVVGLYSSLNDKKFLKKNMNDKECCFLAVTSGSGGVGVSTVAAALTKYLARNGKKVLYLSMETNAAQDIFFDGAAGDAGFSDMIYLLKSKKANLALRAESIVQRDSSGAYYFRQCRNTLDMCELKVEDISDLVRELCILGDYEYVIADYSMRFTESDLFLANYADGIIVVCDGSMIGCKKLRQLYESICILDSQKGSNIHAKMDILYNRFSSKSASRVDELPLPVLGGVQRFEGVEEKEIVRQILSKELFTRYLHDR